MGPVRRPSPISEIDVLWLTAGLSCDGDTIAMTAATQPSIEDIVLGAFPWIPKVHFYNPFLAADNGEDFMAHFHRELEVFRLIGEGRSTRQIAEKLHLSIKTVETYQAHIKDKLSLHSGRELVQHAIQANISEKTS